MSAGRPEIERKLAQFGRPESRCARPVRRTGIDRGRRAALDPCCKLREADRTARSTLDLLGLASKKTATNAVAERAAAPVGLRVATTCVANCGVGCGISRGVGCRVCAG